MQTLLLSPQGRSFTILSGGANFNSKLWLLMKVYVCMYDANRLFSNYQRAKGFKVQPIARGRLCKLYGTVLTVIWPHSPYREAELMMMTDSHILYCLGVYDDGDIFNEENLVEFRSFVMEATDNKGVHFVMADGVSKKSGS